jgi:hypothetical protein
VGVFRVAVVAAAAVAVVAASAAAAVAAGADVADSFVFLSDYLLSMTTGALRRKYRCVEAPGILPTLHRTGASAL